MNGVCMVYAWCITWHMHGMRATPHTATAAQDTGGCERGGAYGVRGGAAPRTATAACESAVAPPPPPRPRPPPPPPRAPCYLS
eukprot:scaffold53855_cov55-Phaeocystis_antarctica.AAC.2